MIKCVQCGCDDKMLHRTAPKGETPANWTCLPCIEKTEPELAANIREDYQENPIMETLEEICKK